MPPNLSEMLYTFLHAPVGDPCRMRLTIALEYHRRIRSGDPRDQVISDLSYAHDVISPEELFVLTDGDVHAFVRHIESLPAPIQRRLAISGIFRHLDSDAAIAWTLQWIYQDDDTEVLERGLTIAPQQLRRGWLARLSADDYRKLKRRIAYLARSSDEAVRSKASDFMNMLRGYEANDSDDLHGGAT